MRDLILLKCDALPSSTRVVAFRGSEGVSRLYAFDVYFLLGADGRDLDPAAAIGAKATLELRRAEAEPPFVLQGIFVELELVHELEGGALFRARLVPKLWLLTQTLHSRIYTGKSIPEIVESVLLDGGLVATDFELRLAASYPPEEHVCQYKESHFDFFSRWLEREGMYYFFERGDGAEKLVITDHKSFHTPLREAPVRFFALGGHDTSSGEALHSFTSKHRALPAQVRLKDYDYTSPALDVAGSASVSPTGVGVISVYGGRFLTPADGKRLAGIRSEELLARQIVYRGAGTAMHLRAGHLFQLEQHPRPTFDQEYLVTEAEHRGAQAAAGEQALRLTGIEDDRPYWVELRAIPSTVQYRSECRTAWPRVDGFENATICGPAESEYAQIDEHGRYNIKFKFDESDLAGGHASTWVRMLQPHGGGIEGWHFPLRKGTEVLLLFLGGDPDRPVIAGVVPNAHTPSPVTSVNHTTNVIQTGGRNRFELEDEAGSQRITLTTPTTNAMIRFGAPNDDHNMIVRTDGTTLLDAGSHWDVRVGGHLDERVTSTVTETYSSTKDETVTGQVHETYEAGQLTEVTSGVRELQVTGALTEHCTGTATQDYDTAHNLTTGPRVDHVKGTLQETADGAHTLSTGARGDTVNGALTQTIHGTVTQIADGAISITAPSITETSTGPKSLFTNGSKASFTYGASFSADLSASLSLFAGIKLSAEASIKISATAGLKADFGSAVNLRASPLQVTLGAAMTTIQGSALVDVVTPCLMVPAASIVLL